MGPKDAFDESAQGLSPCEDDVNRHLNGGPVVGRIGEQVERVESEVVLIGKGNNERKRTNHGPLLHLFM